MAKPSSRLLVGTLALLILGCGTAEAPVALTRDLILKREESPLTKLRREDALSQETASFRFLAGALRSPSKANVLVDTFGLNRQIGAILMATEGPLLKKLSDTYGPKDQRVDLWRDGQEALTDHLIRPNNGFESSGSFWMVWPILLTPEYQFYASNSLGMTVKRLGSGGIGAQREIDRWIKAQSAGAHSTFAASISKADSIVSLQVSQYDIPWDSSLGPSVKEAGVSDFSGEKGNQSAVFSTAQQASLIETPDWRAALLKMGPRNLSLILLEPKDGNLSDAADGLSKKNWSAVTYVAKRARVPAYFPSFSITGSQNLEPVLENAGLGFLTEPGLDLGYMAMELRAAEISRWIQLVDFSVSSEGIGSSKVNRPAAGASVAAGFPPQSVVFDKPFLFMLRDDSTGAILAAGAVRSL